MIEISGRSASVPEDERFLGFTGDNDCEVRVISLKNESLAGCSFKIDVCGADGARNILEPEKSTECGEILLTWVIKKEHIRQSGALFAQVRAFDESGMVWHSDIFEFEVCGSIEASEAFEDADPSEFKEIEKAVTAAKTSAEEAAAAAEAAQGKAETAKSGAESAKSAAEAASRAAQTAKTTAEGAAAEATAKAAAAGESAAAAKKAEDSTKEALAGYAKKEDIKEYTAGNLISIENGVIKGVRAQSYSDLSGFSGNVIATPNDMPDLVALVLSDSGFSAYMSPEKKKTACANLGAAKESDVAYASQTAKGTIRAWLTAESGESVLNLATEDEADET